MVWYSKLTKKFGVCLRIRTKSSPLTQTLLLEYLAWMVAYRGSISGMRKIFCLPHSVQTVFGAHPAYPVATDSSSAWPTGRAVKPSPRSRAGVKNGRSKRLPQTPINVHGTMHHSQMQLYLHVYPEDDGKTCTEALLSAYQTKRCHNPKHHNAKPRIHHFMLLQQTSALLLACNFKFVE
jgi:hypothetical protein